MDHNEKEVHSKHEPSAEAQTEMAGTTIIPPHFNPTATNTPFQKKDDQDSEKKISKTSSLDFDSGDSPSNLGSSNRNAFQLKSDSSVKSSNGLPENLQSNMEALSGIGLNDVKVHQNSSAPKNLGAHAFAQGSDIHIAPGQEKHLPHEAWHVVQQRQGRVQANTAVNGAAVNDNPALEGEADTMGAKAASSQSVPQLKKAKSSTSITSENAPAQLAQRNRKKNKKKKKKKKKNKNKASSAPAAPAEKGWFEEGTYSGAVASVFSGWSEAPEEDETGWSFMNGVTGENEDALEHNLDGYKSAEGSIGDEEEEGGLVDSISINIITKKTEHESGAESEVSGGISADGIKGSGEIEIKRGYDGKIVKDGFIWDKTDGLITTKSEGEIEGFAGAKAEGELEGSFNPQDYSASASGKASAFAGLAAEGSVNVNVMVNGVKTFAGKGTLGVTAGVGVEGGFHISWQGGQFKMGGKGKVALGVGISGGYELTLDPKSILKGMAAGIWKLFGY